MRPFRNYQSKGTLCPPFPGEDKMKTEYLLTMAEGGLAERPARSASGLTSERVTQELKAAGYALVDTLEFLPR